MNLALKNNGLRISAVLVGLAVPSLVLGKAAIGITLGLAFLVAMICASHQTALNKLKSEIPPKIWVIIFALILLSAVNIPFSEHIGRSFEAWLRTWLLGFAIFYLVNVLRDENNLIVKSALISSAITLLLIGFYYVYLSQFHFKMQTIDVDKFVFNGILLSVCLIYISRKYKYKDFWNVILFITIFYFIITVLERNSKATLAGILIITITTILLLSIKCFSIKKALGISIIFVIISAISLYFWLPDHLNFSSTVNQDTAFLPVWIIDFHRQLIWTFSADMVMESPWVGFGLNASNYSELSKVTIGEYFSNRFENLSGISNDSVLPGHPHNWVLELFLDGGLILLLPTLLIVCWVALKSIKIFLKTSDMAILSFICVHFAFWGTGLLNFSFWSTWWQASYLICAAVSFYAFLDREDNKTYK